PIAALAQPHDRRRYAGGARFLCELGVERTARDRAGRMESRPAQRTVDAIADFHRYRRSRLLLARHVHAAAAGTEYRVRHDRGGVRFGDASWFRQPCAWRSRRFRRGDAGGTLAVRQGSLARRTALVPRALLHCAVRDCAAYSWCARNMAQYERYTARCRAENDNIGDRADPH